MDTTANNEYPNIYGYCISDDEMKEEAALNSNLVDIRKVIDYLQLNYLPGDMVNIDDIIKELKYIDFELYLQTSDEDEE